MNQQNSSMDPRERQARRAALRKKKAQQRRQQQLLACAGIALLAIVLTVVLVMCNGNHSDAPVSSTADTANIPEESTDAFKEITWATFPEDRQITAQQYFVFDCTAGMFRTISQDPTVRIYPASITKLITASIALQYLQSDQMVTVGEAMNMVAAGSSVAELKKGDTVSVKDLIGGMILPSGNDAAYALALEAGRVILQNPTASADAAVSAFVSRMNEYAGQIGMSDTHFANPDGIHQEDHYTTYADLITMALHAMSAPAIMDYCATPSATVNVGDRELQWHNTNLLLDPQSAYYCPYAIGLKTGQTPYAGSCLLSAFDVAGSKYVIGVFGCPDIESRFADTLQLLNQSLVPAA